MLTVPDCQSSQIYIGGTNKITQSIMLSRDLSLFSFFHPIFHIVTTWQWYFWPWDTSPGNWFLTSHLMGGVSCYSTTCRPMEGVQLWVTRSHRPQVSCRMTGSSAYIHKATLTSWTGRQRHISFWLDMFQLSPGCLSLMHENLSISICLKNIIYEEAEVFSQPSWCGALTPYYAQFPKTSTKRSGQNAKCIFGSSLLPVQITPTIPNMGPSTDVYLLV